MLPDQLTDSRFIILLDALTDGIVWARPAYNDQGTITDFYIEYINQAAHQFSSHAHYKLTVGTSILDTFGVPGEPAHDRFNQLLAVSQTGQAHHQTYLDPVLNQWVSLERKPLDDGVLLIIRPLTSSNSSGLPLTSEHDLLQTMLDGAINGVLLLEPLFDASNAVIDYRIMAANRAVKTMTNVEPASAIGRTMGEVYPGYKAGGFFSLYCKVLADGQLRRAEFYYEDPALQGWFEVSVVRQENRIVLTFSNTTETRQSKKQLEEARNYLQSVIDFAQTGIFVFSPVYDETGRHVDFRFKAINRMVAGLVKQTPDVIQGAVASDWFVSYRETGLFDRYKHTYDTGEQQRFEINYNVDGFDVWFDVQCARQDDDVLVTYTDITPVKQAQQATEWQLRKNQEQASLLNSIVNNSDNGIMAIEAIRDPNQGDRIVDFRFLMVNKASEKLVGKRISRLIGRSLLRVFPGSLLSGLFDAYVYATNTGEPYHTELHYKYDGLDSWLTVAAQKLGDGLVVTFSDISVIKRAATIVERSAEELQTVIDTSQTGIFLFDPVRDESGAVVDFRFRMANRQLAAYVGQEPAAVIGALGSQWFPDYQTNTLFERYLHTYETGETLRFDFHYYGSGIDVWLDIMSTKLDDAVLVTFADYTPLKHLQQQLESSIADLKRSNDNLQQFAYVASHDLQEPLRKIQAFGDILKTSYAPKLGDGADIVNRMQLAATRMSVLIRDLLTYSRLSSHREEMRAVLLTDLLSRVIDDLGVTIKESGASIQYTNLPTVIGDALQLQQLFQNLISNAIKFRRPDIAPEIIIQSEPISHASLPDTARPIRQAAQYHAITVTDNGIGFDEKYRERIFQVFQRLHGRQQYPGTGIGLAIAHKVVDNHGGAIIASSQPGQGTSFTVFLPIV